jgi:hypothetical protein
MANKHPRPLGKGKATRPAIIFKNIWVPGCWTYHDEEKVRFGKLDEARAWASKHGFNGIWVELTDKKG